MFWALVMQMTQTSSLLPGLTSGERLRNTRLEPSCVFPGQRDDQGVKEPRTGLLSTLLFRSQAGQAEEVVPTPAEQLQEGAGSPLVRPRAMGLEDS